MRLATLRTSDGTVAARQDNDSFTVINGYADVGELLANPGWKTIAASASGGSPLDGASLASVITKPGKIICVGLNYRKHIQEMGRELPEYPTLFSKYAETLIGPTDDIELPEQDDAIDWENSTPLGPVLVTTDEWTPGGTITTRVDGELMQEASTGDLVHGPEFLVSYISTMITLHPGDTIITGTPGGVGHARQPQRYLRDGQVVETSIEGIGTLRNRAVAANRTPAE